MESGLSLRLANPGDLDPLLDLLSAGARYAQSHGIDMWPDRFSSDLLLGDIERAELYVGHLDGVLVATLTHTFADPPVWGADDGRASYVHRLAVSPDRRGGGLGHELLAWAGWTGVARGRPLLRLDTLHENTRLRAWYERSGFAHVRDRDIDVPPGAASRPVLRVSLYERPVAPPAADAVPSMGSEEMAR
jgi:ribosomal protein S18 acetylase RimI-like enzyme